ncbi:MAG: biopolymer transporter ExbD [Planctomycetaceae bacterium]|jgi:biopolymer transport protein ExbD|nr:biopolymer transporter ExbD [Planctomycetaceae bacterium]
MKFKSKAGKCELDMTPMIDIVFLLISFFMVLINFSEADTNERIKLPVSELAKPPDTPPTEPIVLQVLANGNIIYANTEYNIESLRKKIEFQLRLLKMLNIAINSVNVIIRADAGCEAGKVQDVIDLCRSQKLENFKLRVKQNDQE